jgi:pimeloyl-ACP methyl ester carboxylesterase
MSTHPTTYHTQALESGVEIFYRQAGNPAAPTLLLLHGFPTSSHMFRDVIPLLAERYHVIAPDLPGFGHTKMPAEFSFSFDALASAIDDFTRSVGLDRFALFVFDYGAPVGFRLALADPGRITALITQNGNAYEEGLSSGWEPIRAYWNDPSPANRDVLRGFLAPATTQWQYSHGADPARLSPDGYTLDNALLARPGQDDVQLDLFRDYASNLALYPAFQRWLRESDTPVLAVWGKNDPFFLPPGAEAFRRDVPDAEIRFFDTGHFALETHAAEIAGVMLDFLGRMLRDGHRHGEVPGSGHRLT